MYEILFSKQAGIFVQSLLPGYRQKLKDIVTQLQRNPFSYPYKKLRGEQRTYRIRLGRYRILYEVHPDTKIIYILKVEERGNVY